MTHPLHPHSAPAGRPGESERSHRASWSAFAVSILVHGAVIILVGGYVIYEGVVPRAPFIPAEGVMDPLNEEVLPEPSEIPETPDLPSVPMEMTTATAQAGEATSSDILVSTGTQPQFSLPPAIGSPTTTPKWGVGMGGAAGELDKRGAGPPGKPVRSLFGQSEAIPAALVGTLYDLKQKKGGGEADQYGFLKRHAASGFDRSNFRDFYAAATKLYATQIFMPMISAEAAPKSFQVENEVKPKNWIAHYVGQFAAPKTGNYRFVGQGDDILIIRVGGKVVFDGSIDVAMGGKSNVGWTPQPEQIRKGQGPVGFIPLVYGDWMALEKGVNQPIEILLGEIPGGNFCAYLFIEQEGEKYATDGRRANAPVLPIFRLKDAKDDWSGVAPHNLPAYQKEGPVFTPKPGS